jgi:hypothetical protein
MNMAEWLEDELERQALEWIYNQEFGGLTGYGYSFNRDNVVAAFKAGYYQAMEEVT